MKKELTLETTEFSVEGKILAAIHRAKEQMQSILSINIPAADQKEITDMMLKAAGKKPPPGLKLESLYGYQVKDSEKLSITIKI